MQLDTGEDHSDEVTTAAMLTTAQVVPAAGNLEVDRQTAAKLLVALVRDGVLVQFGQTEGTYYKLRRA